MQQKIVVFDFETGNLETGEFATPIQIAGIAMDGRTLELIPVDSGGEFCSMMKPVHFDKIQDGALKVNKKTREEIAAAPGEAEVWPMFCEWVKRHNPKGTKFTAPIPCGHNIVNFDIPIVESLCKRHKIKASPLSPINFLDTKHITFLWFENSSRLEKYNLDLLRDFLGMSHEGAHDALQDCRDCATIIAKYLRLMRRTSDQVKFEGACANAA